ncbi:MAG: arylsulfatase [Planctomycetota bacterium]|nr:MAG: arylsulfatase [Planctomycetota bacterium]
MPSSNIIPVILAGLFISSLLEPTFGADGRPGNHKPNIIFILADDLGYGDLGCYGQKQIQTPSIDRLAAEGMRFTDCYAGHTVCAPSRCCLMTGLHTGHALVRGNANMSLRPEDVTVAEILKKAGYKTGIIGKWGLGKADSTGIPNRQGFDEWFGYLGHAHAHNYYPDFLWKNKEKYPLTGNVVVRGVAIKRAQYSHDLFTQEALEYINRHRGHSFFLYLAYTIPHTNNERANIDKEGNGMEVPSDEPYSDKDWPQAQKNRAAMITRMDRDIGKIVSLLKELDLDRQTVIFFSSDNGPDKAGGADPAFFDSTGGLKGYKNSPYEGGIRVPMIVYWPGKIRAGVVSDQIWAFWDFLPTAADIAGADPPGNIDGISILPTLLGKKQKSNDYLYWEFHRGGFCQAVRMHHWKALRYGMDGPIELYDLSSDIQEVYNIAVKHPDVVARIEEILKTARSPSRRWRIR